MANSSGLKGKVLWLWLSLGILLAAAAAFFLWPTLEWYLLVPAQDKEAALGPLENLRAYVQSKVDRDFSLLRDAPPGSQIPGQFQYLVVAAAEHFQKHTSKPPSSWLVADLFGEYPDQSVLSSNIASHYRKTLFRLKRRSHLVVGLRKRGIEITVRADFASQPEESRPQILETVRGILIARARSISSDTLSIYQTGPEELTVRIPGARDADLARSIIETRGVVVFRVVDGAGLSAVKAYAASGNKVFGALGDAVDTSLVPGFPKGSSILGVYDVDEYGLEKLAGFTVVHDEIGLNGTAIQEVEVNWDPVTGEPVVNFRLTPEGGEAFYKLTSSNVGQALAVVLDDHVKASAVIREPIRDQVRLAGFTEPEAQNLALVLRSGSLPIRLEIVSQHFF